MVVLSLRSCLGKCGVPFNVLRTGNGLGFSGISSEEVILIGDVEGKVHLLYPNGKLEDEIIMETKGGSIQVLFIHPITKLSPNEFITGDAQGVLTLFSNLELLSRESLPNAVSSLTVTSGTGLLFKKGKLMII